MKDRKENIERKVKESFEFLDHIEKVESSPFFDIRLEAKLDNQVNQKSVFSFLTFPVFSLKTLLVGIILLINIVSISMFMFNSSSNHINEISNIVEVYDFDQSDYFLLTLNDE